MRGHGMTAMTERSRRNRELLRYGNAGAALVVSVCLLGLLGAGFGVVPALGRALVPGHGVWTSAAGGRLPASQTLRLAGLSAPAQVTFSHQGVASVYASTDDDAFLALGYVHAEFRLTEMDLERRLAEGQLAQLTGASAVGSDTLELQLGLLRTAQQEWAQMPGDSPAARALIAYSAGVNDYLARIRTTRQWPALFSLAGVYPRNWTPVDSLAVQGGLTQELDFTTTPLDDALLDRSLGTQRTAAWFGVLPPNRQSPYDPGPYRKLPLAPVSGAGTAGDTATAVPVAGPPAVTTAAARAAATQTADPAGLARAAAAVLARTSALPPGQLYSAPASNAWAANGSRVSGGGAMLAGDPHLPQTLPSVWYQVAITAPGLAVSGVSVPGLPGVLIGHNARIAWSLTDTQSQAALFYHEQTTASRPGEYFWDGQWRRMQTLHYTIAVHGSSARQLTVEQTVHGPVLTQAGQTVSVDWMGALGSPDLADVLAIDAASNYRQFRAALASWRSPALNFVYADNRGNIGAISAGYFPQVRHGEPWLPLPGSGADDVAGVIPYAAVPQVYNPRSHLIVTANQRPVASSYPYYLGTTADEFDPGYRADTEHAYLTGHSSMGTADFAALQNDVSDGLAGDILPALLSALHGAQLTPAQQQAEQVLSSWDERMSDTSAGAAIWWTFWTDYLAAVFKPWWTSAKVPARLDPAGLSIGPGQFSLDADLQVWTLHDQGNPAFTPPGAAPRTAVTVMRTAFATTVRQLVGTLHESPDGWTWGALHTRQFPSLTGASALGYGPRAAGGDLWTVDAAEGGMNSVIGPSWRMIVGWDEGGKPEAEAIYPGGQSENPASPWYSNLVADWWAGSYLRMPSAGGHAVAIRQPSGPARPASVTGTSTGPGASPGRSAALSAASPPAVAGDSAPPRAGSSAGLIVWELLP
jgi:penicillin G amidase